MFFYIRDNNNYLQKNLGHSGLIITRCCAGFGLEHLVNALNFVSFEARANIGPQRFARGT